MGTTSYHLLTLFVIITLSLLAYLVEMKSILNLQSELHGSKRSHVWRPFFTRALLNEIKGVAAIETAIILPIVIFIFFAGLQLILVMINLASLRSGVEDVIGTYESMYIKEQDNLRTST